MFEPVERWLVEWIRARIGDPAADIDVSVALIRYGLDSVSLVALVRALGAFVGRPLPATLAWEHPSVEELARAAVGEAGCPVPHGPRERTGGLCAASSEPIAIVGIGCRLPGAPDRAAFWRLLRDGVDATSELPAERARQFRDVDPGVDALLQTRRAGFLAAIDQFDPGFFGISPREANQMDPQQRLVLEVCWEALQDAGIPAGPLRNSSTGVYMGACWSDYLALASRDGIRALSPHSATGVHFSIVANRVSYLFGLQGPSLTVDSACSSSLTAIHLACQALRGGECTAALAGGVNVMSGPDSTVAMSRLGALAPDGRSKAFDRRADGYGRGEGAAVVVLKRLARALVDGDRVYAVIRGSAVNNDGPSNGLTAPNQQAQEALLRAACERAGLRPADVAYVESHGTGTPLGDPIEARALGKVFGHDRPADRPLRIGSVKTNIGHVESAAGVAGLVKVALSLDEGLLPASLHFEAPNPHIDFGALGLAVQRATGPWPEGRRAAGVSSFGFGGTNAHAVLEARPPIAPIPIPPVSGPRARVVFVCAGYGGHWDGMARSLLASEPDFAAALRRCDRRLLALGGASVLDALAASEVPTCVDVLQPVLFAIQVGLAEWLAARGVRPDAVIGHSFGEVAAAWIAGMIGFEDGRKPRARMGWRSSRSGRMRSAT
ncbi:MAG: hypothetical protein DMG07_04170 [Acidobacteria bacterium]|nr:MAG: hypothetical protein DMG07_04170 [Acidobacteriota bacterium]